VNSPLKAGTMPTRWRRYVPSKRLVTFSGLCGVVKFGVFPAVTMKMPSSEMLRRVALVRTDVSEELSVSIIRKTRIGKLGTTLAVTSNRRTLRRNAKIILWSLTRNNAIALFLFH
jgi:hypothetical protein